MSVGGTGLVHRWRWIAIAMLLAGLLPMVPLSADAANGTYTFKPNYEAINGDDVPYPITTCFIYLKTNDVVDCFTYDDASDVTNQSIVATNYEYHLVQTTTGNGYFGQSLTWMPRPGVNYYPDILVQPYVTDATAVVEPASVIGTEDITVTFTNMILGGRGETEIVSFTLPADFTVTSIGDLQCHNTNSSAPCPSGIAVNESGFQYQKIHDQADRFSIAIIGQMTPSTIAGAKTFSACSTINTSTTCADATLTVAGNETPTATATLEPTATTVPTNTPTLEPTDTPTLEPTGTPVPTNTPTLEPTATTAPTDTPPATETRVPPTATSIPPTATASATGTSGETLAFRPSYSVSNSSGPLPFPFTTCVFEPDGAGKFCVTYTSQADVDAGRNVSGWEHQKNYPYTMTTAGYHSLPRTLKTEGQPAFTGELVLYLNVLDVTEISVDPATVSGPQIITFSSRSVVGGPGGTNVGIALSLPGNFVAMGIQLACSNGSGQDSCPAEPHAVDTSGFTYGKPSGGTDFWDMDVTGTFNGLAVTGAQAFSVCISDGDTQSCESASTMYTLAPTATSEPTGSLIPTSTSTATIEPTGTLIPTSTSTATIEPTGTLIPTSTSTATIEPTGTLIPASTSTATIEPTGTLIPTSTSTATSEPTGTLIPASTSTVTSEPTGTLIPTSTSTATIEPTGTLIPTSTSTLAPRETSTPVTTTTPLPSKTSTPGSTGTPSPTGTPASIPNVDPDPSLLAIELPLVLADGGAFPIGSTICIDGTDISQCRPLFPELAVTIGVDVRGPSEVRVRIAELPPGHYTISLREMEPYLDMAFPVELNDVLGNGSVMMEPLVLPKAGADPRASPVAPPDPPRVTSPQSDTPSQVTSASGSSRSGSGDIVTTLPTTGLGEADEEDSNFVPLVMLLVTMLIVIVAVWRVRRSRLP